MIRKITFIIAIAAVMTLGSVTGVIVNQDVFASGQGNGNDSDKGKAGHGEKGCETATEASDGKTKNPHCADVDPAADLPEDTVRCGYVDEAGHKAIGSVKFPADAKDPCLDICNDSDATTHDELTQIMGATEAPFFECVYTAEP